MSTLYSENPKQFNVELINELNNALLEIAKSGMAKHVKKGDFDATYRNPAEIEAEIDKRKMENVALDGGLCTDFFRKRRC